MMSMKNVASALLTILVFPATAMAADTWTDPFPGVRQLDRETSNPNWRIHAMEVDLCAQGVSLRATKAEEYARTTSSFGNLVGANIAVNGDFFGPSYAPIGLAFGDGENWSADVDNHGWIGFGPGNVAISEPIVGIGPQPWLDDAVGGNIMVVSAGNVTNDAGNFCTTRHPRTAAGLSQDGQTLYLAVVDGRSSASVGMTCTELGNLMKELGAHDAINLDGGGSTTMWTSAGGVLNNPSDGSQRTVANHLGVLAGGTGEPEACNHFEAELTVEFVGLDDFYTGGSSEGVPDVVAGDQFQAVVSLTSRTPRRWQNPRLDYWFEDPYLSATNYVIESDHPEHDQATWTVNSADSAPENPAKDAMGATGTLEMHAYTLDETKRIVVDLRADQYSVGFVDHPDLRAWLRHIDGVYGEQDDYFADPTNGNRFGENIRAFAQLDVLSPAEWQFEDGGAEGWTNCSDDSVPAVEEGAMVVEDCVASPMWSATPHDHLVLRFAAPPESAVSIGLGDELIDYAVDSEVAVLDLSDGADVDRFSISTSASIDGIWFQSADGAKTTATEEYLDGPLIEPESVDINPTPVDDPPDGPSTPDDPGDEEDDDPMNSEDDDPVVVKGEGGCCAVTAPGSGAAPAVLGMLLFGLLFRRRRRA